MRASLRGGWQGKSIKGPVRGAQRTQRAQSKKRVRTSDAEPTQWYLETLVTYIDFKKNRFTNTSIHVYIYMSLWIPNYDSDSTVIGSSMIKVVDNPK